VWLKAAAPASAYEAPRYELLAEAAPDRILAPLAIDTSRGWLLLPDGGPTLGDRAEGRARAAGLAAPRVDDILSPWASRTCAAADA